MQNTDDGDIRVFLLTRPLRDVTNCSIDVVLHFRFLLTRPLRDVTHLIDSHSVLTAISTHTPLAGRDDIIMYYPFAFKNFYSHAPCGT